MALTGHEGRSHSHKKPISYRIWYRIFASFFTLILLLAIALAGAAAIICRGPSPTARDIFVVSVMETGSAGFLARVFLPEEDIRAIMEANRAAAAAGSGLGLNVWDWDMETVMRILRSLL